MVYPTVSDDVSIPDGTPNGTLFVSVDKTWGRAYHDPQTGQRVSLEDCARGYWTDANLAAAHASDCEWLMARLHGRVVGVWKIDRTKGVNGWMPPSATPKKTWPSDKPKDRPRSGCELIARELTAVDEETKARFLNEEVHLGRCPNSLRGYFISDKQKE